MKYIFATCNYELLDVLTIKCISKPSFRRQNFLSRKERSFRCLAKPNFYNYHC